MIIVSLSIGEDVSAIIEFCRSKRLAEKTDIRNRKTWDNPWEGQVFGKNKFQSRLWWKNLRTALKTAGKLGIEMGIFNCPGWSQSGGPWVKPDEAMRNWTPNGIEICKTKQGADVTCGPCNNEAQLE